VPAGVAVDAQESMGEHATFEVRPDLSLHEPDDGRALPSRPSEEGLELLANDFVEKGLLGFMGFVLDDDKESAGTMGWSALPTQASGVPRSRRRQAERLRRELGSCAYPIPLTVPNPSPLVHAIAESARTPRCNRAERDGITE